MNFCKENDKYISLYIDELLDDKRKMQFLKHTEECKECAEKLKEASYFAELCRDNQDIELPEDFASSLHKRLLEEVHPNQSKSNPLFLLYNKKFIASLSTAAILVISLLAYNLLPQIGTQNKTSSTANDMQQQEASTVTDQNKSGIMAESAEDGALSNSPAGDSQAGSTNATKDVQITLKFNQEVPEARQKAAEPSTNTSNQDYEKAKSNSHDSAAKKDAGDQTALFTMKLEDQPDANNQQYFLNYAELNLKVTPGGIEIEDLRKFMIEQGAIEQKPVTISSVVTTTAESITLSALEEPQFIDYYLPLNLYSTLVSQAAIYKLDLSAKTDIIKNDITDIYKELNTQKQNIDKKIEEAIKRGDNTSTLEAEKTRLTEEMNKIITEKEMITVRVFFTP